ncbi:Lipid storage droplets surface-binding protein 2 [Gryllus bimaculatus]|nr:Lipid storage droplets surface-binding protein 2 [Gryllus bimaculatus]
MPNVEHNYSPKVADEAQDDTSTSSPSFNTPSPPPVSPPLPAPAPGPFPEPDPEEARVPEAAGPPPTANTDGNVLPASHLPINTCLGSGQEKDHEKDKKLDKQGDAENGQFTISDTNGKSGKLKIVERVVQLPIMKCTVNVYDLLKTNTLTGWSVYLAETTAKITLAPAMYMASALASVCNLPVRCVDATLCLGLDVVEAAFPCVKVYPNQVSRSEFIPLLYSFISGSVPTHHQSATGRVNRIGFQIFCIMARAMEMEDNGLYHPPCNDDCPCRQRRLLFSEDYDDDWKPCLLVRSIQGCYFNSVYVCGVLRSVVRHPKDTVQAVPAKSWRFLHNLLSSEQGRRIMCCLSAVCNKLHGAAGMVVPSNPPLELEDDKVLHLLLTLCDVPSKSMRRFYEAIVNTIDALNTKYAVEQKIFKISIKMSTDSFQAPSTPSSSTTDNDKYPAYATKSSSTPTPPPRPQAPPRRPVGSQATRPCECAGACDCPAPLAFPRRVCALPPVRALARAYATARESDSVLGLVLLAGESGALLASAPALALARPLRRAFATPVCKAMAFCACGVPAGACYLSTKLACKALRTCLCDVPAVACGLPALLGCSAAELCLCDAPAALCGIPGKITLKAAHTALGDAESVIRALEACSDRIAGQFRSDGDAFGP